MIAKRAAVQSEVSAVLRPFYCELCDKQFQNVAQYDEHTNSYAHHHKARFRDMQAAQRASSNTKEEVDKRKEKERKREEKELRKLAKAAGIKLAKPPMPLKTAPPPVGGDGPSSVTATAEQVPSQPRSSWTSVGTSSSAAAGSEPSTSATASGAKSSGWTSLGSANDIPPRVPQQPSASSNVGSVPSISNAAPAFRTGGWSSLDTTSPASLPAPVTTPSTYPPQESTPTPASSSTGFARGGWSSVSSDPPADTPPSQPPTTQGPSTGIVVPSSIQSTPRQKPAKTAERQESSRSGWQQFRSGGAGRRR